MARAPDREVIDLLELDRIIEVSEDPVLRQQDLAAARAIRGAQSNPDGDLGPSLIEILVAADHVSMRQANRILSSREARVLKCPDCRAVSLLHWHRFFGGIFCPLCRVDLSAMKGELYLPQLDRALADFVEAPSLVGRIDGTIHMRRRLSGGRYLGWYLGERRPRREPIVLLELQRAVVEDPAALARMKERFAAVGRLPTILRPLIFDLVVFDGRYFAMQTPISGPSISEIIVRDGPLSSLDALRIFNPIAELVRDAHAKQLHGFAIFPEMIVLEGGTETRLLDLGTGFMRARRPGQEEYWPDECLAGAPESAASDVYSLCAIGLFLLTGEPPRKAQMKLGEIRKQQPELIELFTAGLAKDPAVRPLDLQHFVGVLHRARQHQRWLAEQAAESALVSQATAVAASAVPATAAPPPTAATSAAPPPPTAASKSASMLIEIEAIKERVKTHIERGRKQQAILELQKILILPRGDARIEQERLEAKRNLDQLRKSASHRSDSRTPSSSGDDSASKPTTKGGDEKEKDRGATSSTV